MDDQELAARIALLTDVEREDLRLVQVHITIKKVARARGVGPETIKTQLASARLKLGARRTLEAAALLAAHDRRRRSPEWGNPPPTVPPTPPGIIVGTSSTEDRSEPDSYHSDDLPSPVLDVGGASSGPEPAGDHPLQSGDGREPGERLGAPRPLPGSRVAASGTWPDRDGAHRSVLPGGRHELSSPVYLLMIVLAALVGGLVLIGIFDVLLGVVLHRSQQLFGRPFPQTP